MCDYVFVVITSDEHRAMYAPYLDSVTATPEKYAPEFVRQVLSACHHGDLHYLETQLRVEKRTESIPGRVAERAAEILTDAMGARDPFSDGLTRGNAQYSPSAIKRLRVEANRIAADQITDEPELSWEPVDLSRFWDSDLSDTPEKRLMRLAATLVLTLKKMLTILSPVNVESPHTAEHRTNGDCSQTPHPDRSQLDGCLHRPGLAHQRDVPTS
jgi:hypothetical protein